MRSLFAAIVAVFLVANSAVVPAATTLYDPTAEPPQTREALSSHPPANSHPVVSPAPAEPAMASTNTNTTPAPVPPLQVTSDTELRTFGEEFQALREQPSHFKGEEGGEWNPLVDPFHSRQHRLLEALQEHLGKKGTDVERVLSTMGDPDETTYDLDQPFQSAPLMPGPIVGDKIVEDPELGPYLVYYWRGRHDFVWFQLGEGDSVVATSGWHLAGE